MFVCTIAEFDTIEEARAANAAEEAKVTWCAHTSHLKRSRREKPAVKNVADSCQMCVDLT